MIFRLKQSYCLTSPAPKLAIFGKAAVAQVVEGILNHARVPAEGLPGQDAQRPCRIRKLWVVELSASRSAVRADGASGRLTKGVNQRLLFGARWRRCIHRLVNTGAKRRRHGHCIK